MTKTFEERFTAATLGRAPVEPSSGFAERVMAAVRAEAAGEPLRRRADVLRQVRVWVLRAAAVLVVVAGAAAFWSVTMESSEARARQHLARQQGADGLWHPEAFNGQSVYAPALSALSALCLDGEPERYSEEIARALSALESKAPVTFTTQAEAYNQALCAFGLVSLWQTGRYPELEGAALRAIEGLAKMQRPSGGWTYESGNEGNAGLSAWNVRTLALAGEAGNTAALKKGLRWLARCQRGDGEFRYAAGEDWSTPTLNAMVACAFQTAGLSDLVQTKGFEEEPFSADYYRQYFAIAALRAAGKPDIAARLRRGVERLQAGGIFQPDQQWSAAGGEVYSAAFALLSI